MPHRLTLTYRALDLLDDCYRIAREVIEDGRWKNHPSDPHPLTLDDLDALYDEMTEAFAAAEYMPTAHQRPGGKPSEAT